MTPAADVLESIFTSGPELVDTMRAKCVTRGLSSFDAAVKHVRIGPVPDRGGRPDEARSVRDMPSFKPRSESSSGGGGGGGGGGGRGGGGRGGGGDQGKHRGHRGGGRGGGGGGQGKRRRKN